MLLKQGLAKIRFRCGEKTLAEGEVSPLPPEGARIRIGVGHTGTAKEYIVISKEWNMLRSPNDDPLLTGSNIIFYTCDVWLEEA